MMNMFVDTHAHLMHQLFEGNVDAVIQRAKAAGVGAIICSGVNHPTNEQVLALAKKYPLVKACLGLYPIDLLGKVPDETGLSRQIEPIDLETEFSFIKKNKDNIIGIGEVGLDYKWSTDEKEHQQQKENLQRIIDFTQKLNKPIVIHSRNAEKDCIDLLESSSLKRVQLHCFEGNKKLIKRAADLGYYFSIPAHVTRLQHFQMLAQMVDLSQLLTETDAPWLPAELGTINEPANVVGTVKMIAELKKIPFEEVKRQIWENYQRLFLPIGKA